MVARSSSAGEFSGVQSIDALTEAGIERRRRERFLVGIGSACVTLLALLAIRWLGVPPSVHARMVSEEVAERLEGEVDILRQENRALRDQLDAVLEVLLDGRRPDREPRSGIDSAADSR